MRNHLKFNKVIRLRDNVLLAQQVGGRQFMYPQLMYLLLVYQLIPGLLLLAVKLSHWPGNHQLQSVWPGTLISGHQPYLGSYTVFQI